MDRTKILLIDDEDDFCFFIKNNLEKTGEFEVITSNRSKKGIKMAEKEKPALILLDIVMPKLSGADAIKILLDNPQTRQIPVIFLTAIITKEEVGIESIKEIGHHNFISKTVDIQSLISSIKKVLEEESRE